MTSLAGAGGRPGITPRVSRAAVALVVGAAWLLVTAGPAAAHGSDGPTNEEARLRTVTPPVEGLAVELGPNGRVTVVNRTGTEVVVMGYDGEPFLRLRGREVEENRRSPATYANTSPAGGRVPPGADPSAEPEWAERPQGATWFDHRLHRGGPGAVGTIEWTFRLAVDGHPVVVAGEIVELDPPPAWPWWLVAAALAGGGFLAARRRRLGRRAFAVATLAAAGAVAVLATGAGGGIAWAAAVAGVIAAGLVAVRGAVWVAGIAGLAIAAVGVMELGDLRYAELVVSVADPLYRAAVAGALGLGVALAVAGYLAVARGGLD